nr:5766_t:CDS:2 [Entrophospora candida]
MDLLFGRKKAPAEIPHEHQRALQRARREMGQAGPLAYGCCQAACNLAWVSCYAASGLTAGAALPTAALACNVCQGVCMTAYAGCFLAPTP